MNLIDRAKMIFNDFAFNEDSEEFITLVEVLVKKAHNGVVVSRQVMGLMVATALKLSAVRCDINLNESRLTKLEQDVERLHNAIASIKDDFEAKMDRETNYLLSKIDESTRSIKNDMYNTRRYLP